METNEEGVEFGLCQELTCMLRFPISAADAVDNRCPRCGSAINLTYQTRTSAPAIESTNNRTTRKLSVVLDNLRSAYNVGSIFRTADGAGANHMYLCGITPNKDHPKVAKTALGAEQSISSSYHTNGLQLSSRLKTEGVYLIGLESVRGAESIFDQVFQIPESRIAIVVGNEKVGVDPAILSICDQIAAIPMSGVKRSLNVVVAFGIAAYKIVYD